eukprot:jgi/Bigna1/87142/estExt_fgenesh1_pg.C_170066
MSGLKKLQHLSLVQKVCEELENHLGINNKDLAEFIIHLASKAKNGQDFQKKVSENGAELKSAFAESLYRIISVMKPKSNVESGKKKAKRGMDNEKYISDHKNKKAHAFPGLAMPNRSTDHLLKEDEPVSSRDNGDRYDSKNYKDEYGRDKNRKSRFDRDDEDDRGGGKRYRRGRHGDDSPPSKRRRPKSNVPEKYEIYDGTISKVMDFGAFVSLDGFPGRVEGLVHVSAIRPGGRIMDLKGEIKRGQKVKVKVLSMIGSKISLSMRDVNQKTGEDLRPNTRRNMERAREQKPRVQRKFEDDHVRPTKTLSEQERWELNQLIAAGAIPRSEGVMSTEDSEGKKVMVVEDAEEELEIELREEEPSFLRGQTELSTDLSPVKVVKNPEGSLNRAALTQSALAKERRELREQQRTQMLDKIPQDISKSWEDPTAKAQDRHLAASLRDIGQGVGYEIPEWKRETVNKNLSYGIITNKSIKEQREGLPIYKLRNQLLQAIQRANLGNIVLTLKAMGINDMLGFDFMDPPPVQTMVTALETLYTLGALDEEGLLTRLGRKMAEFPLEPSLSKILITSADLGCSEEILSIVGMLSVEDIFYRPKEKQAQADMKKAKFFQPEGDHLTFLTVYQSWAHNKFSNPWCYENYLQARALRRAQDVRKQLVQLMDRYRLPIESCGKNWNRLRKAITSGYFMNAAKKDPQEGYKTIVEGQPVYVHPGSALFNRQPDWLIYHQLVLTSKEYMRSCMTIEPKWLVELAPNFYKKCDPNVLSKRKRREKIEPLYDRYHPPNEWRLSRRRG